MINRKEVLEKYNGHCAYCGKEITLKEMQVDHKHPYIDGLKERIEELEAFIDRLVEAGRMMKQPETIEEFHRGRRDYDALVAEWKEREE